VDGIREVEEDSRSARPRVAANLRALIESRLFTISSFAARSGISRRYLQTMLAGQRNFGIDALDRIATHLAVQTWRLLAPLPPPADTPVERSHRPARVLLACRVRRHAATLELTRCDVARIAGCGRSHLLDLIACRVSVGVDLLPGLAGALRVELHELLLAVDHL
jgi:transcriptional regulator with XRE-family HTH domain